MGYLIDYLGVGLLGALVGIGELVSRYRDAPEHALIARPALLYIALNAAASCAGLALIHAYGWTFTPPAPGAGAVSSAVATRLTQVLVAGAGALVLFRSSIINIRVGGQDVGVGPIVFFQVVLGATDNAVDRLRAVARQTIIKNVLTKVSYVNARVALPAYCMGLMQNLPARDQEDFARRLREIDNSPVPDDIKARLLGLALLGLVGEDLLTAAVRDLGKQIEVPSPVPTILPPDPGTGGRP